MWFIPMGIVLGAKVSFTEFLVNNLLPVTLGNTLVSPSHGLLSLMELPQPTACGSHGVLHHELRCFCHAARRTEAPCTHV